MSAIVRKCTIAEIENAPNFYELLEEYGKEMVVDGAPPFKAKIEMYRQLESLGSLRPFGAYVGDKLVGFITVLVHVFLHVSVVMAVTESFFVLKDYRNTGAGIFLRRTAEKHAKSSGSSTLFISAPKDGPLADALSKMDEYTETSRVFFRSLKNV